MTEAYRLLKEDKNICEFDSKLKAEGRFLLELNFWMRLQEEIQKNSPSEIDTRRRFSFQKIAQHRIKRAYGIISGDYRIQIDKKNKVLIISEGKFDLESNWKRTPREALVKIIKSFISIKDTELFAQEVFNDFKNYQLSNS